MRGKIREDLAFLEKPITVNILNILATLKTFKNIEFIGDKYLSGVANDIVKECLKRDMTNMKNIRFNFEKERKKGAISRLVWDTKEEDYYLLNITEVR